MADFKNDFVPALSHPIKWSTGDNTFEDSEKNPKTLSLAICVEDIPSFINYLMALEADTSKPKQGKVWNSKERTEEKKSVVYINAKGRESNDGYGCFGNINPRKIDIEPPF